VKAVVYEGPRNVSVKDVPDARIERPTDVLVRITTTNICGSDLHMYEGRTDFETGRWFGHENMGQVIEVGEGVDKVKVGAHQLLPDRPTGAELGRGGLRLRRHGPVARRSGRAAPRAMG
jgi:glutathione-independent formaldehyde dehydrogenase